jgi:curli biogenesis system outer membrane secretion channel CsgG
MIFLKIALSVTAIVLFIGTASFAESGDAMPGEQAQATGMPTPLSAPKQKIQSAEINPQAGIGSAAVPPSK